MLKRKQRIVVNFAGIYFQLLFNIILILALIILPDKNSYIISVIKINIFVALYALIPFIRNDGYWIYSDYFDIQNLNQKSNTFFYQLYKRVLKKESNIEFKLPLAIYSMGNYLFLGYIIYNFIIKLPQTATEFIEVVSFNGLKYTFLNHFGIIAKLLMSLFFCFLLIKAISFWCKEMIKYKSK